MSVNNKFKPVSDIDYVINAVHISPISSEDSRYFDCSKMRGCDTAEIIERKLRRQK